MKRLQPVTRYDSDTVIGYVFECPGCKDNHFVSVGNSNPSANWSFNGDIESPTFSPSLLVRSGHHAGHYDGGGCWCTYNDSHPDDPAKYKCYVCHSFIRDGKIQFLNDCTHDLAGQTVEMPVMEEGDA